MSRWLQFTATFVGLVALAQGNLVRSAETKPTAPPGSAELRFTDDSRIKLVLREEHIELTTAYGKLRVPLADIRRIDFATRVSAETSRRIDKAISDLGSPDEKVREQAVADLLSHRDRAYPALVEAAKMPNEDIKRLAEEVLRSIAVTAPEGEPIYRKFDTIHTEEMKISGKIDVGVWKAKTTQFGDVEVKLADLHSLRTPRDGEVVDIVAAQPDPGNLEGFRGLIGQKFAFRVTGVLGNSLYGTDVYTTDSLLANAAVHMGVLKAGQVGTVRVEIVAPLGAYQGSTRNGVTSTGWGPYGGAFKILK